MGNKRKEMQKAADESFAHIRNIMKFSDDTMFDVGAVKAMFDTAFMCGIEYVKNIVKKL